MRSSLHSFSPGRRSRRRLVAASLAGAFLLAACGGSDSADSEGSPAETLPTVEATPDAGADDATTDATAAPATGSGFVDLVGADVVPAAENGINPLPDVVVDDLTNDRKVNFRNLVPQDKPVLLWMYAPH